ncbi:MAG: uracil-DNA glycosylase [Alphaproteobacteria bacterium]|nr:MAG: uracil-DNA glycosylase [Alphaproteobacteria bacterium]
MSNYSGANDAARQDPLSQLKWLVDAGADEVMGEAPVNRFKAAPPAPPTPEPLTDKATPATPPRPSVGAAMRPTGELIKNAQGLAQECQTLGELREALSRFEGCGLKQTAHSTVFADGNPKAELMLIGEAPGRDEDREGRPFVGRSGQLLDLMMAAINRDRSSEDPKTSIYIANILPWRPPGNRNPSLEEISLCLPFLKRHIEIAQPKILLALGGTAAKHLLETPTGIMKLRGRWAKVATKDGEIDCMATFHPAYLLRQPGQKKYAWADLLQVEQRLQQK